MKAVSERPDVVIVGSGTFAKKHAQVVRDLGYIPHLVTAHQARMTECQKEGWSTFSEVKAAVDETNARGIIVASRPSRHLKDLETCLEFKLPILLEKPVVIPELYDEAAQLSVANVFVGCVLRAADGLQKFKKHASRLGAIHHVSCVCQTYLPDWRPNQNLSDAYVSTGEDGGVLSDLIHEIDYVSWIFGSLRDPLSHIPTVSRLGLPVEEQADIITSTDNVDSVHFRLDYLTRNPVRKLIAYGEKGEVEWDGIENKVRLRVGSVDKVWHMVNDNSLGMLKKQDQLFLSDTEESRANLVPFENGLESVRFVKECLDNSRR